jgi:hypothetical protein
VADRFGLSRQNTIIDSGIRAVFTPFRPVLDVDLLFDRSDEVARLMEVYTTPGQHGLIFENAALGRARLPTWSPK